MDSPSASERYSRFVVICHLRQRLILNQLCNLPITPDLPFPSLAIRCLITPPCFRIWRRKGRRLACLAVGRGASKRCQGEAEPGCDRCGAPEGRKMKAQGASPGAAAPYPALKGRYIAGDADSMAGSRSVPPFQGGVHRKPIAQGVALGYRLPPLRGSIGD